MISIYFEIYAKHVNVISFQNVEIFTVKLGCTWNRRWCSGD